MSQFNYTPTTSGVQVAAPTVNKQSSVKKDIDAILSLTQTGLQVAGAVKKEKSENDYNSAKNKYLARKQQHTEGLEAVLGDAEAYEAYNQKFKEDVALMTEGLTDNYKTMFNSSTEGFINQQNVYVSQSQAKQNKINTLEAISSDAQVLHTMPSGKERQVAINDLKFFYKDEGLSEKEISEKLFESHINYATATMQQEDINYSTLKALEKDMNDYLEADPKLKNSKAHQTLLSRLKTSKNSLDSIEKSKIQLSISNKDIVNFTKHNDRAYEVGAIDKETHDLNKITFGRGLVSKKELQLKKADEYFGIAGGNLDIDYLKVNADVDKAVITRLEQLSTRKINTMLQGNPDYEGLRFQNNHNPKLFTKAVSNSFNTLLDKFITSFDSGITPEQQQAIENELVKLDNISRAMPNALDTDTRNKAMLYTTVFTSPYIKNKQDAFSRLSQVGTDYKQVSTNDKTLSKVLADITDSGDKIEAQKMYSSLRYVGVTEEDASKAITDRYNPREIKGSNVKITGRATDYFGFSQDKEEYLLPSLQSIYSSNEKLGSMFKKAISQEGAMVSFLNGELVVTSDTGTKVRFPVGTLDVIQADGTVVKKKFTDVLKDRVNNAYRIDNAPNVWQNIGTSIMNGIADGASSAWGTYDSSFIATTGKVIVKDITNVTTGVVKEGNRLLNTMFDNYKKWENNLNKQLYKGD